LQADDDRPAGEQNQGTTATTTPTITTATPPQIPKEGGDISGHVQEAAPDAGEQVDQFWVPSHPRFERHEAPKHGIWRRFMPRNQQNEVFVALVIALLVACLPVAIIGGLSQFRAGQSTAAQRGVMIAWMVCSAAADVVMLSVMVTIVIGGFVFAAVLYGLGGRDMLFVLEDAMTLAIRFYGVLLVLGSAIRDWGVYRIF
jgi:hypothetical protein